MPIIPVLYAVAMAVLLAYGLNLLWMAVVYARHERLRTGPVPDPDAVEAPGPDAPVVTVQLPLYNEAEVAERLIDACAALRYPRHRLEIQVLDDSTDETAALVARRVRLWRQRGLDIVHVHRTHREGYKAGALANGLRMARGAFVAVFDADFVPTPDFLLRLLPRFGDPRVGMVQARWGHLNADDTLLTRIQAFGLDAHFAVEQYVRGLAGCFINFNGTAGLWRRACIDDAGGWQSDTLAEDLDLSYRAQLRGWRFRFADDVEVPAEVPVAINALRAQQFRWTKGAAETARKLLGTLWRSEQPRRVKIEGTFHLTAHLAFPFVVVAAALHAPLLVLEHLGRGPGPAYFAVLGLGLVGFAGFFLAQLFAQRALYPDWGRRLLLFPLFLAGSMGMALNNTRAIWQAVRGRRTAFVRTPKHGVGAGAWWKGRYADARIPPVVWLEGALAVYCGAGLVAVAAAGAWAAVPFQAFFALAFGLVTVYNVRQYRQVRA
ncbi:MAG: glycosyltransferase [Rhodothermales bacterium]|nr:glycosyltransferase [Rhodothermales bacterium]